MVVKRHLGSGLNGSDKLKECVPRDNYVNGCRLLAVAGSVTPSGALAYSWSHYNIVNTTNMMDYDKCCVCEHLLFVDVHVNTCQARVTFDMPHTNLRTGKIFSRKSFLFPVTRRYSD